MKKYSLIILMSVMTVVCSAQRYTFESVPGDITQTRIYTLDNGLKVYLSVNKEKPRLQANIAVRTGSRNDPAETTGLAHYLEQRSELQKSTQRKDQRIIKQTHT